MHAVSTRVVRILPPLPNCPRRARPHLMTNTIAVFLGIFIIGMFAYDDFMLNSDLPQFLMRKLIDLTEYIAFWR